MVNQNRTDFGLEERMPPLLPAREHYFQLARAALLGGVFGVFAYGLDATTFPLNLTNLQWLSLKGPD